MVYGHPVRREGLWLSVLGPLRAWRDAEEINLGAPQQRTLLAVLLVRCGDPVMMREIIDVLWPENPPSTVTNVVQRYISQLRRLLPPDTLMRSAGGYFLDLGPDSVDLMEFRGRVAEAAAIEHRDPARATDVLVDALRLWRAPVAANVDSAIRFAPMFVELDNELVTVALQTTRLALGLGRAGQLLPVLHAAAAAAPLNERLQAAIMQVLAATGCAAEALARFAAFRSRLSDELGVEPGPQLMAVHRAILDGAPLESGAAAEADPQPAARPGIRLAQLPADLPTFAGRSGAIERLSSFLRGHGDGSASARIVAVSGLGGIGKTTLAVHCGHLLDADFPGGQLYVNMRGFDPSGACVKPQDALRSFLTALGVSERDQPQDLDAQVALYRSMIAGRQIIVVIDNVRDSQHARPLLPGTPGCAAIVTSRDALTGLIVAEGALPVVLNLLSRAEAEVMLEQRLGARRVATEPGAVDEIIAYCVGVPLALAIFSARAATHPQFALGQLSAELAEASHRLDSFGRTDGDNDLRAVFSWSYDLLGDSSARLFRLLAIHPGPAFGATTAASLMAVDTRTGAELLGELGRANLLIEYEPGRFRMHDLVRAYSAELLVSGEPEDERRTATRRLLDHYLHGSLAATAHLDSHRRLDSAALEPPVAGVTVERFADFETALNWFAKERPTLLMVLDQAVAFHADTHVWYLAWAMDSFVRRHDFWRDWEATQLCALAAAQRLGDVWMQAWSSLVLGHIYYESEWNVSGEGEHYLLEAVALFAAAGDRLHQAHAHRNLAAQLGDFGRPAEERRQNEAALSLYLELERDSPGSVPPDYIASVHEALKIWEQGLPYALKSVKYLDGAGNHREAGAWNILAHIHVGLHNWTECVAAAERSFTLYQAIGNEYLAGVALHQVAIVLVPAGRPVEARAMLERAVQIFRRIGHQRAESAQELLDSTGTQQTTESETDSPVSGVR
ncbi:BTAD domain-containing putative transcriptional regulator [Rugosimonospora acidiphila]|uniref:BTAD domain-containing putative transcriptional regulator n=1 Tax=Rugosimonospora acidiphila TaxID=556531 RepID=A0ABP9SR95_9ACTN